MASLRPRKPRPARFHLQFPAPLLWLRRERACPGETCRRLPCFIKTTHSPHLTSQQRRPGILDTGRWVVTRRPFGVFTTPLAAGLWGPSLCPRESVPPDPGSQARGASNEYVPPKEWGMFPLFKKRGSGRPTSRADIFNLLSSAGFEIQR